MHLVRLLRSAFGLVALGVLSAGAAACDDAPLAPSHYAPFSQTDLRVGTGAVAVSGSVLSVSYSGWLYNASEEDRKGARFDASPAGATFSFTLGAGQVIKGWDQGLVGMSVGGLRRLVVPPSLAYGASRNGPVPPNATLLFEIELHAVEVQ